MGKQREDRFHAAITSRYVGLLLLISCLGLILMSYRNKLSNVTMLLSRQYNIEDTCVSGTFRDVGQLPYSLWKPYMEQDLYLPMYWTHPLTEPNNDVKYAIIIQHGNLRNANNYFCAALESIQEILSTSTRKVSPKSFLIISPQFLIDGDICWHPVTNQLLTISLRSNITCNYYIWNSEGWKDGHAFLNRYYVPTDTTAVPGSREEQLAVRTVEQVFYSYDIFNLLINQLTKSGNFPNLEKIVLFGFSAGGQTLLRYAMYPQYATPLLPNSNSTSTGGGGVLRKEKEKGKGVGKGRGKGDKEEVEVQFVVADISSYLYLDDRRPLPLTPSTPSTPSTPNTNHTIPSIPSVPSIRPRYAFAVPNISWIVPRYQYDAAGKSWLSGWSEECAKYNDWRYGLKNMRGYFAYHAQRLQQQQQQQQPDSSTSNSNSNSNRDLREEILQGFLHRNIHFLVGMNDSVNCKLTVTAPPTAPVCNDNELATYCQAMLQGENRLDRFEKWKAYIDDLVFRFNYTQTHSAPQMAQYATASSTILTGNLSHWIDTLYQNNSLSSAFEHVNTTAEEYVLHNKVWYVKDVAHDPIAMLKSKEAKCLIFNYCPRKNNYKIA